MDIHVIPLSNWHKVEHLSDSFNRLYAYAYVMAVAEGWRPAAGVSDESEHEPFAVTHGHWLYLIGGRTTNVYFEAQNKKVLNIILHIT